MDRIQGLTKLGWKISLFSLASKAFPSFMNIDNKSCISSSHNFITKREHKYFPITLWYLQTVEISFMFITTSRLGYLLVLPLDLGFCVTELKNTYFFFIKFHCNWAPL